MKPLLAFSIFNTSASEFVQSGWNSKISCFSIFVSRLCNFISRYFFHSHLSYAELF